MSSTIIPPNLHSVTDFDEIDDEQMGSHVGHENNMLQYDYDDPNINGNHEGLSLRNHTVNKSPDEIYSSTDEDGSFLREYRDLDRPVQLSRCMFVFLVGSALFAMLLSILAISGLSLDLDEEILHVFYGPGFRIGYRELSVQLSTNQLADSIQIGVDLPLAVITIDEYLEHTLYPQPHTEIIPEKEKDDNQHSIQHSIQSNQHISSNQQQSIFHNHNELPQFQQHHRHDDQQRHDQQYNLQHDIFHSLQETAESHNQTLLSRILATYMARCDFTYELLGISSDIHHNQLHSTTKLSSVVLTTPTTTTNSSPDTTPDLNQPDLLQQSTQNDIHKQFPLNHSPQFPDYDSLTQKAHKMDKLQSHILSPLHKDDLSDVLIQLFNTYVSSYNHHIQTSTFPNNNTFNGNNNQFETQSIKHQQHQHHQQQFKLKSLSFIPSEQLDDLLRILSPHKFTKLTNIDPFSTSNSSTNSTSDQQSVMSNISNHIKQLFIKSESNINNNHTNGDNTTKNTKIPFYNTNLSSPSLTTQSYFRSYGHSLSIGWDGLPMVSTIIQPYNLCLLKCSDLICSSAQSLLFTFSPGALLKEPIDTTSTTSTTSTQSTQSTIYNTTQVEDIQPQLMSFYTNQILTSFKSFHHQSSQSTQSTTSSSQIEQLSTLVTNTLSKPPLNLQQTTDLSTFFIHIFDSLQSHSFSSIFKSQSTSHNSTSNQPFTILQKQQQSTLQRFLTNKILSLPSEIRTLSLSHPTSVIRISPLQTPTVTLTDVSGSINVFTCLTSKCFPPTESQASTRDEIIESIRTTQIATTASFLSVDVLYSPLGNQLIAYADAVTNAPILIQCLSSSTCELYNRIEFDGVTVSPHSRVKLAIGGDGNLSITTLGTCIPSKITSKTFISRYTTPTDSNIIFNQLLRNGFVSYTTGFLQVTLDLNLHFYVDVNTPQPTTSTPITDEEVPSFTRDINNIDYTTIFERNGLGEILNDATHNLNLPLKYLKMTEIYNILLTKQSCLENTKLFEELGIQPTTLSQSNLIYIHCSRLDCLPGYYTISMPFVATTFNLTSLGYNPNLQFDTQNKQHQQHNSRRQHQQQFSSQQQSTHSQPQPSSSSTSSQQHKQHNHHPQQQHQQQSTPTTRIVPGSQLSSIVQGILVDVTVTTTSVGFPLFVILYQPLNPITLIPLQTMNLATAICYSYTCHQMIASPMFSEQNSSENETNTDTTTTTPPTPTQFTTLQSQSTYTLTGWRYTFSSVTTADLFVIHSTGINSLTNRVQIRTSPYGVATTLIQYEHLGQAILAECVDSLCTSLYINTLFLDLASTENESTHNITLNSPITPKTASTFGSQSYRNYQQQQSKQYQQSRHVNSQSLSTQHKFMKSISNLLLGTKSSNNADNHNSSQQTQSISNTNTMFSTQATKKPNVSSLIFPSTNTKKRQQQQSDHGGMVYSRTMSSSTSPMVSTKDGVLYTTSGFTGKRGSCTTAPCGDIRISSVDGMPLVIFGTENTFLIHCSNMLCLPHIIY